MDVLEDEDERPPFAEPLEEPPPGREGFVAALALRRVERDERTQVTLDPGRLLEIRDEVVDPRRSFASTVSPESLSRIPVCALTISPSAQNVTPSP